MMKIKTETRETTNEEEQEARVNVMNRQMTSEGAFSLF